MYIVRVFRGDMEVPHYSEFYSIDLAKVYVESCGLDYECKLFKMEE